MPWWCDRHKQHSIDDVCTECTKESASTEEILRMKEIVEVLKISFPKETAIGGSSSNTGLYEIENGTIWQILRLLAELKELRDEDEDDDETE